MNELQIFNNTQFGQIRTVLQNGEPWFVAKDVCDCLEINNSRQALNRLDSDEKNSVILNDGTPGNPEKSTVNEYGLYTLVLSSRKPEAKQFKRWITHEVLPQIRKTGGYGQMVPQSLPEALRAYSNEVEEHNKAKALLEVQRPKVVFADAVSASNTSILVGELAKMIKQNGHPNMGQNRLFEILRSEGYLISRKGTDYNMPTQRAMEMGLFEIKETAITHSDGHVSVSKTPKVTGKGQQYFINRYLRM